jgi:hypothetical protein
MSCPLEGKSVSNRPLSILVGLLCCHAAYSANYVFDPWTSDPLAFGFSFEQKKNQYTLDNGTKLDSQVWGIRAELFELTLPMLNLSMAASRYEVEAFGSQKLTGDASSFELATALFTPKWHHFRLASRLTYIHNRLDGSDNSFSLRLHGAEINTIAMLYLFDIIALYSGAGIDGAGGTMTGSQSGNISFAESIGKFYVGGMDILLGQGGHVGLESKYGKYLSLGIYFQRRY